MITQNIDGLHAAAGSRDVIEVHGSIASASCLVCGARYPLAETRARFEADGDGVPRCDCGQPLKPDVVLFGELLDEAAIGAGERARRAAPTCCSASAPRFEVYPVAGLPEMTLAGRRARGHRHAERDAVRRSRRCGSTATWRRSSGGLGGAVERRLRH